jgi:transposase
LKINLNLKKNLKETIKNNAHKELYFFDESRFGTHSKVGHGWFPKGSRTRMRIQLGFKNFYVYSAVSTKTGSDFSIILPKVNTVCMNKFLDDFSKSLNHKEVIVVMDGAGWHKSKELIVPKSIQIIFLPPYSPELNPVEKFWQVLKAHTIKNKLYDSIDALENAVAHFIKKLDPKLVHRVKDYQYNLLN